MVRKSKMKLQQNLVRDLKMAFYKHVNHERKVKEGDPL